MKTIHNHSLLTQSGIAVSESKDKKLNSETTKAVISSFGLNPKLIICLLFLVLPPLNLLAQNPILIPQPQKITTANGQFNLNDNQSVWINNSKHNDFALQQLQETISEQNGKQLNPAKSAKKADIILYSLNGNTSSDLKNVFPKAETLQKIGKQGYWLKVEQNQIRLIANTEQGLFYGVQTLRQLLQTAENGTLSALTITDWPALQYRGWMDDISRGPIPTVAFVKKQIRTLAYYKLNFFNLYTEHTLRNEKFPDIAPLDAFTPDEIMELERYAADYHMAVMGNQQAFGHMEEILKIPFYHDIADNKWNLNPGNPATYEFLDDYLGNAAEVYEHPFFNIGADETDGLGSGKAKPLVDSLGMGAVYAMHINKLDDILKKHGKRTMMWGDIAVSHPEIIGRLPKDLIILSWGYDPRDNFDAAITPFKKSGFDFMVAPGVSSWSQIYPNLDAAVKNIANYVRDGKEYGAMGMMNTAWDDDGETLFNTNWHGLIWGAEMSWKPIKSQEEAEAEEERRKRLATLDRGIDRLFFKLNKNENLMPVLHKLSNLREIPVFSSMANTSVWESIFKFYSADELKRVQKANIEMLKKANALAETLSKKTKEVNANETAVQIALFAAHKAAFAAKKNLLTLDLQEVYANADVKSPQVLNKEKEELFQELYDLKKEYIRIWQAENRAYWLDENLKKYDKMAQELLDLEKHVFIETGEALKPGEMKVNLRTLYPNTEIHYTLDGSEPNQEAEVYKGGLSINSNTRIKAQSFFRGEGGEVASKYFNVHKALGAIPKIKGTHSKANPAYSAGGPGGLTDGLKGSEDFADGRWQGYAGQDIEVTLDLGTKTAIHEISIDFFQRLISWVVLPGKVEYYTSDDGEKFKEVAVSDNSIDPKQTGLIIQNFSSGELKEKARYIKVFIKSQGPLPEWHTGAGKAGYIFLDEIVVE